MRKTTVAFLGGENVLVPWRSSVLEWKHGGFRGGPSGHRIFTAFFTDAAIRRIVKKYDRDKRYESYTYACTTRFFFCLSSRIGSAVYLMLHAGVVRQGQQRCRALQVPRLFHFCQKRWSSVRRSVCFRYPAYVCPQVTERGRCISLLFWVGFTP